MFERKVRERAACLIVVAAFAGFGCAAAQDGSAGAEAPGGAELWNAHCGRCHNARSPTVASDADWDLIALHMRIRANLSEADTDTIAKFLRSGN